MASGKERQRWERWYDDVAARLERQKQSLTRLALVNLEAVAALEEIAAMEDVDGSTGDGAAQGRAQQALDRIADVAAASNQSVEESDEEPIPDPRRNSR